MKRQFRELFRLFFGPFLENDLICLDRDTTGALTGVLSSVLSSVLFPMAVLRKGSSLELLWYIKAHAVALLGGAAFLMKPAGHAEGLLLWIPLAWFVGLYQTQLGWTQPIFVELSALAISAAAGYALSYRGSVSRAFEECDGPPASVPGRARVPLKPAQRASFHFVCNTIFRGRSHRVLASTYAGAGFALVFQSLAGLIASRRGRWLREPHPALLAAPPVLSLFILYGPRSAFSIPAELKANWLFQMSGASAPEELLNGARKATLLLGVLPVYVMLWGWQLAAVHAAFGLTVAWVLMEALMLNLDKVPFTCSYEKNNAHAGACPGRAEIGGGVD